MFIQVIARWGGGVWTLTVREILAGMQRDVTHARITGTATAARTPARARHGSSLSRLGLLGASYPTAIPERVIVWVAGQDFPRLVDDVVDGAYMLALRGKQLYNDPPHSWQPRITSWGRMGYNFRE